MNIQQLFSLIFFAVLAVVLLISFSTNSIVGEIPFFLLGIVVWNCNEYGWHRFAFHNHNLKPATKKFLARTHHMHHRSPKDKADLILPLRMTISLSVLYFSIVAAFAGLSHATFAYTGIVSAYLLYEFMHYSAHHRNPKNPFLKYMQAYHLSHHRKLPNKQFMVTSPIMDYLFGTRN